MKKKILTILLAIALTGNMLAADTVVYAAEENTLEEETSISEVMDEQVSENALAEIATEYGEQGKEDNSEEKIEAYKNIETMVKTSVSDVENANDRDLDEIGRAHV